MFVFLVFYCYELFVLDVCVYHHCYVIREIIEPRCFVTRATLLFTTLVNCVGCLCCVVCVDWFDVLM